MSSDGNFRDSPWGVLLTSEVVKTIVSIALPALATVVIWVARWISTPTVTDDGFIRALWKIEVEYWRWVAAQPNIERFLLIHADYIDGGYQVTILEEFNPLSPESDPGRWEYVQAMEHWGGRVADAGYVRDVIEPVRQQLTPFFVDRATLLAGSELLDSFDMEGRQGVWLQQVAIGTDGMSVLFLAAADSPPLASPNLTRFRMQSTVQEMRRAIGD